MTWVCDSKTPHPSAKVVYEACGYVLANSASTATNNNSKKSVICQFITNKS